MVNEQTYVALLRGINVGGHHKVPMAELRTEMEQMGFKKINTILNSGNIIFTGPPKEESRLEADIALHLEKVFGFSIPVRVRNAGEILALTAANPFKDIEVTRDLRLYVSFLKEVPENKLALPWVSEDKSFRIVNIRGKEVCSVLDVSVTKTPKGMELLEQFFGGDITTRNWNTLSRIAGKID
ncbi:Uncharacterized conserved protein, DUF1697 family [Tangfeifania diversioriginum]|uniref:Uncharacterized conserved protein, DUF1697 family n=1 Tax=Tangfeifania diversioriginum TaxID=1168035 RepID=A0A1M6GAW7_9BACT|nr:DUF1697 domain-containing protein [Tangfeifania diversioriginum]SHJ07084.1 Uncharacterized conserved protein, DUF1697 family [Tangfeifania diversioriginum]